MPNSIVRLQSHENRTPTGRTSATATRKLVNYLAFGRGRPAHQVQRPQRGVWHDQANKERSHDDVLAWVQAQGKEEELRFTHQLILSVKEARLDVPEYNDALAAGGGCFFAAWLLMTHADSDYTHAHVIAFSDEEIHIQSPRFREWWLTVRQALDEQQQAHLARLAAEQAVGQEIEQKAEQKSGYRTGQETGQKNRQISELAIDAKENHLQETASESTPIAERQAGMETDQEETLEMEWEI